MQLKFLITTTMLICIFCTLVKSQTTIPVDRRIVPKDGFGPKQIVVKLDPVSRIPIGSVPFDRTFLMRIYFDGKTADANLKDSGVTFFFLETQSSKGSVYQQLPFYLVNSVYVKDVIKTADYDPTDSYLKVFPNAIDVVVPALLPNTSYEIIYFRGAESRWMQQYTSVFNTFYKNDFPGGKYSEDQFITANNNDRSIALGGQLELYYNQHSKIKAIFDQYKGDLTQASTDLINYMLLNPSYQAPTTTGYLFQQPIIATDLDTHQYTLTTNAPLQVIGDAGLIFTGFQQGFNTITPYVGINIAFRPMDSDIPFKTLVKSRHITLPQRLTFNIGVTLNSITKTGYRTNLFGNDNVMVGLGFKFSHVLNMNFGGLMYYNVDPNPLLDKKTLGIAPFIGLSFNLKIKDALGELGKVFTYGK